MAHGLRVRDNTGKISMDVIDRITRHVYTSIQTATGGNSGALSQLEGRLSGDFCVPVNVPDYAKSAHSVSRSGTTIIWTSWTSTPSYVTPATCVIFSFIYT